MINKKKLMIYDEDENLLIQVLDNTKILLQYCI